MQPENFPAFYPDAERDDDIEVAQNNLEKCNIDESVILDIHQSQVLASVKSPHMKE